MNTTIELAIKTLVAEVRSGMKPDEALKITQAALNLAHAAATLVDAERRGRDA